VTCVGAVTLRDQHVFDQLVNDELFKSTSWVLIGCGVFIIIFVAFGFYGAIKEVRFFLLMVCICIQIFSPSGSMAKNVAFFYGDI